MPHVEGGPGPLRVDVCCVGFSDIEPTEEKEERYREAKMRRKNTTQAKKIADACYTCVYKYFTAKCPMDANTTMSESLAQRQRDVSHLLQPP